MSVPYIPLLYPRRFGTPSASTVRSRTHCLARLLNSCGDKLVISSSQQSTAFHKQSNSFHNLLISLALLGSLGNTASIFNLVMILCLSGPIIDLQRTLPVPSSRASLLSLKNSKPLTSHFLIWISRDLSPALIFSNSITSSTSHLNRTSDIRRKQCRGSITQWRKSIISIRDFRFCPIFIMP
eukprot:Lithocolla_globosa_v1_NODE_841_length_3201_cov_10.126828.p3 type:complete len:182 gc:universal NODE_841_length_3201_cov_10.126828:2539-1994(-)